MFFYDGDNKDIICAVDDCNALIRTNSFLTRITKKNDFDMSTADGRDIAQLIELFIRGAYGKLTVKVYKSANPFSKAYGYFNPAKPDHIFLNSRKLNRPLASICASLIHEMIHFLDSKSELEFGHGSNSPVGKENTAPYWVDDLAENILMVEDTTMGSMAHKIYTPWYYKLINFFKWW